MEVPDLSAYPKILQETTLTVLAGRFEDSPTVFTTSERIERGDSGSGLIWKENGKSVLGAIFTATVTIAFDDIRPQFVRISDFKHWIEHTMLETL